MNSSRRSQLNDSLASATTPDEVKLILSLIDAETEGQAVEFSIGERWRLKTLSEVADFFGVSEQAVVQWRGGHNPMPGDEGNYDARTISRWLVAKRNYRDMPEEESNRHAMREKIKVETEAKRLALQQKKGELVRRDAVAAVNRELFSLIRARIEAIPGECASAVPADVRAKVMEELDVKIRMILKELAKGPRPSN